MGHFDQKFEGTPFFKTRVDTVLCLGALAGQGFVAEAQINRFYQARYRGCYFASSTVQVILECAVRRCYWAPGQGVFGPSMKGYYAVSNRYKTKNDQVVTWFDIESSCALRGLWRQGRNHLISIRARYNTSFFILCAITDERPKDQRLGANVFQKCAW